ncbi:MAG: transcriptional repressor [Chloroflexi bacterium]|nr:transcriptional repressor [Chloroflexota bacterium]
MTNDRANEFAQALRQAGLRLTHPRLAICQLLADDTSHPTATQLHARLRGDFPSLSLATVYSTLNTLVALGLAYELGNAGDGQKHYDPDTAPHANLICTRCHQIRDLDDHALQAVSQRVAHKSGYQIQGARIVYYGVCPACAKRRNR